MPYVLFVFVCCLLLGVYCSLSCVGCFLNSMRKVLCVVCCLAFVVGCCLVLVLCHV